MMVLDRTNRPPVRRQRLRADVGPGRQLHRPGAGHQSRRRRARGRLTMALTITGRLICGTDTPHVAEPLADESGLWRVSWLPGRRLTQSQAGSAMLIAPAAGRG